MKIIRRSKGGMSPVSGRALPIGWSKPAQFTVPIPTDERERLVALNTYDILDTPPEESFNSITLLAAHVCATPVALIVLIDHDRQWFKATVGTRLRETPRAFAFCAYTIMRRGLLVINDAARDKRFVENPLVVGGPKYRFYAGAPLVTPDNRALGTLCVIDRVPRSLNAAQKKDLLALSRLVMTQMELRRSLHQSRREAGPRILAVQAAGTQRE